mmetsp:Transcript_42536/g.96281  ORF Transcript_42536/g.96281 Transcript_42536/m.96281 type:complete len:622 (+) Transcript_42536:199-2064(+)|eukprot:CAMPEP_0172592602 /NCGR_PEP_ID=MMETSP1068-20121228/11614_1 /TAXON_ID=35684 /ORGANISM="Pseudopedinella elastica, Strain CCMP716" /LENGTH=621 /DNA_ID=CAMNT_0013389679 /DNA_START=96 /DNA_END=1961 /DNA_ORIENTATION=+
MGAIENLAWMEMVPLFGLCVFLTWWYASRELVPLWISMIIGVSWFLGFSGTLLLPLDIAQATTFGPSPSMLLAWKVVYWSTFLLTWVVLPVLYEAWYAGEITWMGRFKSALKVNLKFYCLTLVLGVVFGVYLMVSNNMTLSAVSDFAMLFGNTYGLLLVIALMGNGLVELPRAIWRFRDNERAIQRVQLRAVAMDAEVYDASCELEDAEKTVEAMGRKVATAADRLELQKYMDHVLTYVESPATADSSSYPLTASANQERARGGVRGGSARKAIPEKHGGQSGCETEEATPESLARLCKRVRWAQERVHASKQRWHGLLKEYEAATKRNEAKGGGGLDLEALNKKGLLASFQRLVRRLGRPFLGAMAGMCAVLSAIVLWSELTMGLPVSISPWGLLISALTEGSSAGDRAHPVLIQLVALVPFAYMSACTFFSLFRLRLLGLLSLHGEHQTPPGPLIYNAIYLIRLQFPLGLNYLLTLSLPRGREVSFKQLTISMQTVPLFGQGFVVYAPVVLALVSLFTLLSCYERVLSLVGVEQEDGQVATLDQAEAAERLREGAMLLDRAFRRMQPKARGNQRTAKPAVADAGPHSSLSPGIAETTTSPFFPVPQSGEAFGLELSDVP